MFDSIESRVVPGALLVIARSLSSRAFNKVDLPTLGSPHITTRAPLLYSVPSAYVDNSSLHAIMLLFKALFSSFSVFLFIIVSSEISNSNSKNDKEPIRLSFIFSSLFERFPLKILLLSSVARTERDPIRPPTDSA